MKPIHDHDFVRLFEELGATKLAKRLGINIRSVERRRFNLEGKLGRQITAPAYHNRNTRFDIQPQQRIKLEVRNGIVLIGSDGHYWPGEASTAHRAFVEFTREFKPKAVIYNGDSLDAATISRHPPQGWSEPPTLIEEIEVCQERHAEIERVAKNADLTWNLGNHDQRFSTRLATVAPEFARLKGVRHFPKWRPAMATWINGDVVTKHRWKGGIHAPTNNTLWAGKSIITGHVHSAKVEPLTDLNGTRYGMDTGCIADPDGAQFAYNDDNPRNWRSAFGLLTFINGKMLMPELVMMWDKNRVQFRGEIIRV